MQSQNKFCQSCGMPMKKDPENGGTNADGTRNEMYCSHCYQNGTFTFNGNMQEMQELCIREMVRQKVPKWFAWLLTRNTKRLGRWKQ